MTISRNISVMAQGANTAGVLSGAYGGSLTWQSVQTGNFTAVAGNAYPVNTTSGAVTVTLPASPTAGQIVQVTDYAGTWQTNNVTVSPNGGKINGSLSNIILSANRETLAYVYIDSTQGWLIYSGVNLPNPTFSAYANSGTSCSIGVWTKIAFQIKEFDTAAAYSTVNYRFTPPVAGYYQVNACIAWPSNASSGEAIALYKNGSIYKIGTYALNGNVGNRISSSFLVYLNGTTDYIEIYAINNTAATLVTAGNTSTDTWFQASMIRSA
jgi:hypothetical protein